MTIEGNAPAVVYKVTADHSINTVEELVSTHVRLGHIGFDRMVGYIKSGKTRGLGSLDLSDGDITKARELIMSCDACKRAKHYECTAFR